MRCALYTRATISSRVLVAASFSIHTHTPFFASEFYVCGIKLSLPLRHLHSTWSQPNSTIFVYIIQPIFPRKYSIVPVCIFHCRSFRLYRAISCHSLWNLFCLHSTCLLCHDKHTHTHIYINRKKQTFCYSTHWWPHIHFQLLNKFCKVRTHFTWVRAFESEY